MFQTREKLDAFLESTMEKGFVADGVVAQDSTQAASFWQIREVSLWLINHDVNYLHFAESCRRPR